METYWSTFIKFREVPDDQRIEVLPFLEASRNILVFIDALGRIFSPVKNDVMGNIEKMKKKHDMNPEKFITFNDMLEEEKLTKSTDLASSGGLWLKRGLEFFAAFLQNVVESWHSGSKEENIRGLIMAAYEITLKPFHGWFSATLFSAITRTLPYRKDLLLGFSFGKEGLEEKVISDLEKYLINLKANVSVLSILFKEMGLDPDEKV